MLRLGDKALALPGALSAGIKNKIFEGTGKFSHLFDNHVSANKQDGINAIRFRHDEIYTTKGYGKKVEFMPSVFSLLYISLINYERPDTKCNSPHIK